MNRNRTLDVLRITAALAVWFTVYKLYGVFADPLLEGVLPVTLRMILSSMVVPYTVALGAFYLVAAGMPVTHFEGTRKIGIGGILKFFVIQTGLSFPPMIAVNVVFRILNIGMTGLTSDEMFGNLWFYIVLLLIFNPVFQIK